MYSRIFVTGSPVKKLNDLIMRDFDVNQVDGLPMNCFLRFCEIFVKHLLPFRSHTFLTVMLCSAVSGITYELLRAF